MEPRSNHTPLLSTHQLSVGYGTKALLTNINIELKVGELVCFMGPNGIGKSTLIKTLMGLQKPLAGEIKLASDEKMERQISVVLTDRIQHPHLTVEELITLGRYPYLSWSLSLGDDDQKKISDAVSHARVQHLVKRKISELSDGQMQMVMIARALAQDTPILLLDEPTAHLDLNNRVEIMNLLKRLTRETNRGILLATHELDLALQTADHVWITRLDKTLKTGIPEDLVLDGSFDEVFQFKGFDLKTGKIEHPVTKSKSVHLTGTGYEYLWTKNALERNGFDVIDGGELTIQTISENGKTYWLFTDLRLNSISALIDALTKI
jgi:iron complex transport system ATP-binding protein